MRALLFSVSYCGATTGNKESLLPVGRVFPPNWAGFSSSGAGFFRIGRVCGFWAGFRLFGYFVVDTMSYVRGGGHFSYDSTIMGCELKPYLHFIFANHWLN